MTGLIAGLLLVGFVSAAPLPPGKLSFEFKAIPVDSPPPIKVWMFVPDGCDNTCPLQFVMHGVQRNGEEYLGNWIELARHGKFIAVVPEFSRANYPSDDDYSLGKTLTETNPAKWAFAVPELLFDYLRSEYQLTARTYRMFGHSAGGQFVHRWSLFWPENRASIIIAANAGWYTFPEWGASKDGFRFPYNTVDSKIDEARMKAALGRNFVLMLGESDTDPQHSSLNRSRGAMAQGSYRFARGKNYFAAARNAAAVLNTPFAWTLVTVPGVAHENDKMAVAAIAIINSSEANSK